LADIFISYAREDRAAVERLAETLEREGWSVWWDRHIEGGAAFARAIEQELNESKAAIVVWSQASVQSDWVKDEAATARDQGKLVAVTLDGTAAPLGFKQYHVIDLVDWGGNASSSAYGDLKRSVAARMQGPGPATATPVHAPVPEPTATVARPKRTWMVAAGVVLALAVAALFFFKREPEPSTGSAAAGGTSPGAVASSADASPTGQAEKSIAVLPFANRSTREEDAFFAEGIHDDLLSQLARIEDVRVISRTSVMRYVGTDKPIPEIASELGVGAILEGGVQRSGNRVRINVQLIDARTDDHLWAETFDRELTVENLFDIQSEITQAIAAALKSVFSGKARSGNGELPTSNTEAYNAYLLGNTLSRYELRDAAKFEQATEAYGRAVALDPAFVAVHARKAVAHMTLSWWGVESAENIRLAEESLERARELAPQSTETQIAEGYYRYWIKGDYEGAFAALKPALEESPQDARLWSLYGAVARRAGDTEGAVAAWERAADIDPQGPDIAANLALTHGYLGRYREARQWLSRAWSLSPDSRYNITADAGVLGTVADADAMWQRYEELRRQFPSAPGEADWSFSSLALELRDPDRLAAFERRLAEADQPGDSAQIYILFVRAAALERLDRKPEAVALAREIRPRISALGPSPLDRQIAAISTIALDAFEGNRDATLSAAETFLADPPRDQLWLVEWGPTLAWSYARVGAPEGAFGLVEQIMDSYSPAHFAGVVRDVSFDPYRDLPRYKQLLGRYEAWRSSQGLPGS